MSVEMSGKLFVALCVRERGLRNTSRNISRFVLFEQNNSRYIFHSTSRYKQLRDLSSYDYPVGLEIGGSIITDVRARRGDSRE